MSDNGRPQAANHLVGIGGTAETKRLWEALSGNGRLKHLAFEAIQAERADAVRWAVKETTRRLDLQARGILKALVSDKEGSAIPIEEAS